MSRFHREPPLRSLRSLRAGSPKVCTFQWPLTRVKEYLQNHCDHFVIRRLRINQPLTDTDLIGLESTLVEIGEVDGETLFFGRLARSTVGVVRVGIFR